MTERVVQSGTHRPASTSELREKVERAMVQAAERTIAEEIEVPPVGTAMTMNQAAKLAHVSSPTIGRWIDYGWVTILRQGSGQGSATYVDAHDVATIALTWNRRPGPHRKIGGEPA